MAEANKRGSRPSSQRSRAACGLATCAIGLTDWEWAVCGLATRGNGRFLCAAARRGVRLASQAASARIHTRLAVGNRSDKGSEWYEIGSRQRVADSERGDIRNDSSE